MSNQGELSSTLNEPAKLGKQPSQSKSKRIVSNPMSYNEIQASKTLYGQHDNTSQFDEENNFTMRQGHDYGKAVITQLNQ